MESLASRSSAYPMVDMDEAWKLVGASVEAMRNARPAWTHDVRWAAGCYLAADVRAPRNIPAAPCSRLDGFAACGGLAPGRYKVAMRQHAGSSLAIALPSGTVSWVTTGSALPPGSDTVIGVEHSSPVDGSLSAPRGSEAEVLITGSARVGDNVRAAGSDLVAGTLLFASGHQLSSSDIATLLSAGITAVNVCHLPHVVAMSSGDEIRDADTNVFMLGNESASAAGAILSTNAVLDSNRPMLLAMLRSSSRVAVVAADGGIVKDEFEAIKNNIKANLQLQLGAISTSRPVDVLVTTGGVSMGDRDYIKPALEQLCAEFGGRSRILFGRLNMKPGKPTTCALLDVPASEWPLGGGAGAASSGNIEAGAGSGARRLTLVFALPGNPVSAFVGYHTLLEPAVRALAGCPLACARPRTLPVTMLDDVTCDPERPEFHRVTVWAAPPPSGSSGGCSLFARSTGAQASSRLASTVGANGLAWIPKQAGTLRAPFTVDAHLIGPIATERELPPELADVSHVRSLVASGVGAGGGCMCGGAHDSAGASPPAAAAPEAAAHSSAAAAAPSSQAAAGPPPAAVPAPASVPGAYPPHPLAPASVLEVRVGVLTVSTRSAAGTTTDTAGPAIAAWLASAYGPGTGAKIRPVVVATAVAADGLEAPLRAAAGMLGQGLHLLITTGGTGMSPSDVTPEALRPLIWRPAHGLQHAMLAASLRATPMAVLSRYEAGVTAPNLNGCHIGHCLVLQLPGSPKAVRECLDAVQKVLPHALEQLREGQQPPPQAQGPAMLAPGPGPRFAPGPPVAPYSGLPGMGGTYAQPAPFAGRPSRPMAGMGMGGAGMLPGTNGAGLDPSHDAGDMAMMPFQRLGASFFPPLPFSSVGSGPFPPLPFSSVGSGPFPPRDPLDRATFDHLIGLLAPVYPPVPGAAADGGPAAGAGSRKRDHSQISS